MVRETAGGVEVDVRVIPRAHKTIIDGVRDDAVLIRLAAAPVDGAANDLLIEFMAGLLDLPRRAVRVVSGERSRRKRLAIDGVGAERILALTRA
jgi:uncharacterized protein (TIGR00251 family)